MYTEAQQKAARLASNKAKLASHVAAEAVAQSEPAEADYTLVGSSRLNERSQQSQSEPARYCAKCGLRYEEHSENDYAANGSSLRYPANTLMITSEPARIAARLAFDYLADVHGEALEYLPVSITLCHNHSRPALAHYRRLLKSEPTVLAAKAAQTKRAEANKADKARLAVMVAEAAEEHARAVLAARQRAEEYVAEDASYKAANVAALAHYIASRSKERAAEVIIAAIEAAHGYSAIAALIQSLEPAEAAIEAELAAIAARRRAGSRPPITSVVAKR